MRSLKPIQKDLVPADGALPSLLMHFILRNRLRLQSSSHHNDTYSAVTFLPEAIRSQKVVGAEISRTKLE